MHMLSAPHILYYAAAMGPVVAHVVGRAPEHKQNTNIMFFQPVAGGAVTGSLLRNA